MSARKYTLENLDCANCAMKIEDAISRLSGVENVSVVFATKTLFLESKLDEQKLFDTLQQTIDSVEDGVTLIEKTKHHHEHGEHCDCDHEHQHEHHHENGEHCDCDHKHHHEHNH